jgi:hypothetical protein
VSPCLKGRGPFIARRWLDNYKLFISMSTKGFTSLGGPDLRRLVHRGWLEASTVFKLVLVSSRLHPIVPWGHHGSGVDGARVSSLGGCFARSLLGGDVFSYGVMMWMD